MGNVASTASATPELSIPENIESQLNEMSPRLNTQRKRQLNNNIVLQYKLFKMKQPVQNLMYKIIAERQVNLVKKYKNRVKPEPSPTSAAGNFWNSYLLDVLQEGEDSKGEQVDQLKTLESQDILPSSHSAAIEDLKQENEHMQQGQSLYQDTGNTPRHTCPSPVIASPRESTSKQEQSPINKLAVKINNQLIMFQRVSDEEHLTVQPNFIQHIDLPTEWFESENQNSHQLKMMKMMRRLVSQNKLETMEESKNTLQKATGNPVKFNSLQSQSNINDKKQEQNRYKNSNMIQEQQSFQFRNTSKKQEKQVEEKQVKEESKQFVQNVAEKLKAKPLVVLNDDSVSEGSDSDDDISTIIPNTKNNQSLQLKQSGDNTTNEKSDEQPLTQNKSDQQSLRDIDDSLKNINLSALDLDSNKNSTKQDHQSQVIAKQHEQQYQSAPACDKNYKEESDLKHDLQQNQKVVK